MLDTSLTSAHNGDIYPMGQHQMTLLHPKGLNSTERGIEELSLAQLEDLRGGFIWILARFYMQQVYIRSKKEKEEQEEEEFFRRVILD